MTDSAITLSDPDEILQNLQTQIQDDFPALADTSYAIKYVPKRWNLPCPQRFSSYRRFRRFQHHLHQRKARPSRTFYTMLARRAIRALLPVGLFNDREPVPGTAASCLQRLQRRLGLYSELYAYSRQRTAGSVKPLMRCSEASSYGPMRFSTSASTMMADLATATSYLENSAIYGSGIRARDIPGNHY